jgi:hypothetical protein
VPSIVMMGCGMAFAIVRGPWRWPKSRRQRIVTVVHLEINIRVSLRTIEDNGRHAPRTYSKANRTPTRKPNASLRSTLNVFETGKIRRDTRGATRTETRKRPTQVILISNLRVMEYEKITTYEKNGSLAEIDAMRHASCTSGSCPKLVEWGSVARESSDEIHELCEGDGPRAQ